MTRLAPARAGTESAENIAPKIQRTVIAATQRLVLRLLIDDVEPVTLGGGPCRCSLCEGGKENVGDLEVKLAPDNGGPDGRDGFRR